MNRTREMSPMPESFTRNGLMGRENWQARSSPATGCPLVAAAWLSLAVLKRSEAGSVCSALLAFTRVKVQHPATYSFGYVTYRWYEW